MTRVMSLNGVLSSDATLLDRGLHYGDGLFETLLVRDGEIALWSYHLERLQHGAQRLRIPCPDESTLRREVRRVADSDSAVVKLILTRGVGGRGYAPPVDPKPNLVCIRYALPDGMSGKRDEGLKLRTSQVTLAHQPSLAGLKHLNRLEQVLAQVECQEYGDTDALLFDQDDHLVEAISSNVVLGRGDEWFTPRVDRCGVAGTMRAWLLEHRAVTETNIPRESLATYDACCLVNSVRGAQPVAEILGVTAFSVPRAHDWIDRSPALPG